MRWKHIQYRFPVNTPERCLNTLILLSVWELKPLIFFFSFLVLNHRGPTGIVISNCSLKKKKFSTAAKKKKRERDKQNSWKDLVYFYFPFSWQNKIPSWKEFPHSPSLSSLYSTTYFLSLFLYFLFNFVISLMLLSFYFLGISFPCFFFSIHLTNTHCMPSIAEVLCWAPFGHTKIN